MTVRNPDQGYFLLKNGSDYNHLWNGQTALDSYYLTNFLLPSSPGFVKGLLDNFFATQTPEGEIDWKPGLGGQRSQLLSTPLLAIHFLEVLPVHSDIEYLKMHFPKIALLLFFLVYHEPRSRSMISFQNGIKSFKLDMKNTHYFLNMIHYLEDWISSTVESPDLCSFLYQECQSLILIANEIANFSAIEQLEQALQPSLVKQLRIHGVIVRLVFHIEIGILISSAPPEFLGKLIGTGIIEIHQEFPNPIRPTIHVKSKREGTRPVQLYIHGTSTNGSHRVDHVPAYQIHWHLNTVTSPVNIIYKTIEQIEITGISPDDEVIVQICDH